MRSSTGSTQESPHPPTPDSSSAAQPSASQSTPSTGDDIPKGLVTWREAINRAATSSQLAMCLYSLESSIAWDKSIMKAVSEQAVFSVQNARKYNSKLSVGACAFAFCPLTLLYRMHAPFLGSQFVPILEHNFREPAKFHQSLAWSCTCNWSFFTINTAASKVS